MSDVLVLVVAAGCLVVSGMVLFLPDRLYTERNRDVGICSAILAMGLVVGLFIARGG